MDPESLQNEPPRESILQQRESPSVLDEVDPSGPKRQIFLGAHPSKEASSTRNASPSANQDAENACKSRQGSVRVRLMALLIALLPITLLSVAGTLKPDQRGLGTHQQLGLPPCSLRFLVGIRCPACGMTTSWAYFAKGDWTASVSTNAGGFLLACLSMAVVLMAIPIIRTGTPPSVTVQTWLTYSLVGILLVTLLDWVARLQA